MGVTRVKRGLPVGLFGRVTGLWACGDLGVFVGFLGVKRGFLNYTDLASSWALKRYCRSSIGFQYGMRGVISTR